MAEWKRRVRIPKKPGVPQGTVAAIAREDGPGALPGRLRFLCVRSQ